MAYTLTVDGAGVSPRQQTISGRSTLNGADECTFQITQQATGTLVPSVDVGDPVVLTEPTTGDKIFGGFVRALKTTELTNRPTGTYTVVHTITAIDNSAIARRRLVNESWTNTAFETIVADIVANHLDGEGITTNNVTAGPTIQKAIFSWRSVSDAFDELAEMIGYTWWIDADKDLHFIDRGDDVASLSFSPTSRNFKNLEVEESLSRYTNFVILRGGSSLTDSRTENWTGDGTRRVFNTAYPVAEKPTAITAAAASIGASDIGIRGLDTGKKWYWSKGSHELEQDESETVLGTSDSLAVTYKGLYQVIIRAQDAAEIAARAAASSGTSGKYERLLVDASIEDIGLAGDKADGYLRRYGQVPRIVRFETDDVTLRAGQIMSIELPEYALNGTFLVDEVTYHDRGDNTLRFRVTALSGESLGGWQNWWRRLLRKDKIEVGDEFIRELEFISETLDITLTESATEVTGDDRYLVYSESDDTGAYGLHEYGP